MDSLKIFDLIPEGIFYSDLSPEQIGAIELGIILGKKIQKLFPQIAEDYRKGLSGKTIEKKYKIKEIFRVKDGVAIKAVYSAIGGYNGNFHNSRQEPYPGLITDREELKKIAERNNVESGKKSGLMQVKEKMGIHSQTPNDKVELGRLASAANGKITFSDEELQFIYELAQKPEFQRRTRIHAMKIAKEVNKKFHNNEETRKPRSIQKAFIRAKIYKNKKLSFAKINP